MYRENTSLEADRLIAPYLNKWIRLTVTVRDVEYEDLNDTYRVLTILDKKAKLLPTAVLIFQGAWKDQLSLLRRNSAVKVLGRIGAVNSAFTSLQDCEIEP